MNIIVKIYNKEIYSGSYFLKKVNDNYIWKWNAALHSEVMGALIIDDERSGYLPSIRFKECDIERIQWK